jgi:hypothetical protein
MKKDGEDNLHRSSQKLTNITKNKGGKEYCMSNEEGRNANLVGHILSKNFPLEHVIEGNI